ncbi:MAG TPA: tetratricopeptide repeat protein, partial [Verrucomicrobiae bacterium]|nr:tetratricopeptide repeat protein [Verrucomicrobiae bacterium]
RARAAAKPLAKADLVETVRLEALALFAKNETGKAENALRDARKIYPQEDVLLDTLFYIYFKNGRLADGMKVIDEQLAINPDNIRALLNKGATAIELTNSPMAIAALDHALKLQPDNPNALRNRAIARMKAGQWEEAQKDYQALLKMMPDSFAIYYGLGEVAYQRKDYAKALEHFQMFMKLAPEATREYQDVKKRIAEIKEAKAK